jgi:hypothetical protein
VHLIEICNEGEGEPTDVPRQRPRMESAMSRGRASASIWGGRDKTMARRASLMEESARSSCGIASRTALQTVLMIRENNKQYVARGRTACSQRY